MDDVNWAEGQYLPCQEHSKDCYDGRYYHSPGIECLIIQAEQSIPCSLSWCAAYSASLLNTVILRC